jgi:NlpC/P60 family putative phage cell wall peptidase
MIASQVVDCARGWLGTPYKHQHRLKGLGTDCLGLLIGVYSEIIGAPDATIPSYSSSWGEAGLEENMLDAANQYLIKKEIGSYEIGDVLVFRMKRAFIAKHCGIVSDSDKMIHAYHGHGVVESHLVPWWTSKIAGVFKFPEG